MKHIVYFYLTKLTHQTCKENYNEPAGCTRWLQSGARKKDQVFENLMHDKH